MAKDIYHQLVKKALIKDGWNITADPYIIPRTNNKPYEVDLGAEKFIAAVKEQEFIAVEIKSFIGSSMTYDFHTAFGQYGIYRFFIGERESFRKLFLAVSEEAYNSLFLDPDIFLICETFNINILVFNIENEEVTLWIKR